MYLLFAFVFVWQYSQASAGRQFPPPLPSSLNIIETKEM
jgi:hypothetical protein